MKDKELDVDKIDKLLEETEKKLKSKDYKKEPVKPVKLEEIRCPHCNSKNIKKVSENYIGEQFICNECGEPFGIVSDDILT